MKEVTHSRVYLRAFEFSDLQTLNKLRNNAEIYSFTAGNKYFISSEYDMKWIEDKIFNNKQQLYLGICLAQNKQLIGYLSIINIDFQNRKAEWGGILIDPEHINNGYATEAAKLMINHVFAELNINRFYGFWLEENNASLRMAEKLGFKKEGVIRDFVFKKNSYHNALLLSILKSEYSD